MTSNSKINPVQRLLLAHSRIVIASTTLTCSQIGLSTLHGKNERAKKERETSSIIQLFISFCLCIRLDTDMIGVKNRHIPPLHY